MLDLRQVICVTWLCFAMHTQDRQPATTNRKLLEGAAAQLYCGVAAHDRAVIRAFLYSDQDVEQKLVEAHAERILASVQFQQAVQKAGLVEETAGFYHEFRIVVPSDFLSLSLAEWRIVDGHATGELEELAAEGERIPPMVNPRGVWKVNLTPGKKPKSIDQLIEAVRCHAKIVSQVAEDLEAGKIRSAREVRETLERLPTFAPSDYTPDIILTLPESQK